MPKLHIDSAIQGIATATAASACQAATLAQNASHCGRRDPYGRPKPRSRRVGALAILLLVGCASTPKHIVRGEICAAFSPFRDLPKQRTIWHRTAQSSDRVEVLLDGCPSPCLSDLRVSCAVRRDGRTIFLATQATYYYNGHSLCADACGTPLRVTCDLSAIPLGRYHLKISSHQSRTLPPIYNVPIVDETPSDRCKNWM